MMYQIVLIIQIISMFGAALECLIVFNRWKGKLHAYLFFSCVATLVNNVGYYLQLRSTCEEAYFASLRMSYLGRVWIPFSLFMFVMYLVGNTVPRIVKFIAILTNVAIYVCLFTTQYTGLYYSNMSFSMNGSFPNFTRTDGIGHHIFTALLVFYIFFGMGALLYKRRKERNPVGRKRLLMVICAMATVCAFAVIQTLKLLPITRIYDITMLGFPISLVFMYIAILRYMLLGTETLAREYVIDELSEAIIATNEQGELSYFNKPAENIYPDIETNYRFIMEIIRTSMEENEPIKLGDRIYRPTSNQLITNGVKVGTVYVLSDDTEYFKYMAELEKQKALADQANRAKSSFLANMSHEIRTPINAVLGMDEMILRESSEKDIQSYAGDIQTAGKTLLSLINDILDFSKIEEGRMEIIPAKYELSSVINDLINMTRPRADKKGLKLEVEVDRDVPHLLYGDEIRIRQVVINLLTNGVKYTEKGTVSLKVGFRKVSHKEIGLSFTVKDTGIGMKQEEMEKLFAPFKRIEEKRNRSIEGTGLGMSIVKNLLALMDSELKVKSVYGEGSEFSFEILQEVIKWDPMGDFTSRYSSENARKAYREMFHAPDAKILVVDDTEVNLTVIKNLLKKTQINIDTAPSGREALVHTEKNDYDVVFIDHMMPDMDGIETLHRMKEEKPDAATVYIVLTANTISGAREAYLNAGFEDYLSKPVDGKRLEKTLYHYLPKTKILDIENAGEEKEVISLPEWIMGIKELDVGAGVDNCGSEDSYLSVLETFHKTAGDKADEIERLYREGDTENYTIKVHALKSSARIIGAVALSEKARLLEKAGKSGDHTFIEENTENLLEMYRGLDRSLKAMDNENEDAPELSESARREAFQTMEEIAGCMDYGLMEQLIRDIRSHKLSPEDKDRLDAVEARLLQLDWDGITEIVKSV